MKKILIQQKQGIIGKILHNGSCREQSNIIPSRTIGFICHDCCIRYCAGVHLLSNTSQYQFRYHRSNYYRNGAIDLDSSNSVPSGKKDLSIGTPAVPKNNLTTKPTPVSRACLYFVPVSICVILLLASCMPTSNSDLYGTILQNHNGSIFSLQDENNLEVTNQTHMGKVHLITFLFTNCTSLCPIVTSNIKQAIEKSESTKNIPILIISVDPEGDSMESRLAFKDRWELNPNWSYLNGSEKALQSIWSDFYVNPHQSALETLAGESNRKYDVIHTSPVFVVAKDGRPAAVHTNPIQPTHLYKDILTISAR